MSFKQVCTLSIVIILAGCGGGGGSDGSLGINPDTTPKVLTGIFIDSPVGNLDYVTATQSGVTNPDGEYDYFHGETVTFSIGALSFPTITAGLVVTPLALSGTVDTSDPHVLNIVRLLMTLDQDANPENGITINDIAKANATQVDFGLSLADFAASSAVANLIFNAGQDVVVPGLVDGTIAQNHIEEQLDDLGVLFDSIAERDDRIINRYLVDNNEVALKDEESGLYYNITVVGTGDQPDATSTVEVKYLGKLTDGTIFDQTTGDETATFDLTGLIEGWQVAVPFLHIGGKGVFYIPSSLGYGESGSGSIPPNSVLIFEIELIGFQ